VSAAPGRPKPARTPAREVAGHTSPSKLCASVPARLLTLAKQQGDNYNLLLNRFALERLLARVSTSPCSACAGGSPETQILRKIRNPEIRAIHDH